MKYNIKSMILLNKQINIVSFVLASFPKVSGIISTFIISHENRSYHFIYKPLYMQSVVVICVCVHKSKWNTFYSISSKLSLSKHMVAL